MSILIIAMGVIIAVIGASFIAVAGVAAEKDDDATLMFSLAIGAILLSISHGLMVMV